MTVLFCSVSAGMQESELRKWGCKIFHKLATTHRYQVRGLSCHNPQHGYCWATWDWGLLEDELEIRGTILHLSYAPKSIWVWLLHTSHAEEGRVSAWGVTDKYGRMNGEWLTGKVEWMGSHWRLGLLKGEKLVITSWLLHRHTLGQCPTHRLSLRYASWITGYVCHCFIQDHGI